MTKRLLTCVATAATATTIGLTVPASAAVTPGADGTGAVGREDVLRAAGWSNERLQTSAAELDFVAETVSVATASWECAQESTGVMAVRERRTTTTARVPRSTERAQEHGEPALELVHEGVVHRVPTERAVAA